MFLKIDAAQPAMKLGIVGRQRNRLLIVIMECPIFLGDFECRLADAANQG